MFFLQGRIRVDAPTERTQAGSVVQDGKLKFIRPSITETMCTEY